jgi:UDP-3-O-[3-hydroxymyristoyl] glucosamine N-acyltransferase
MYTLGQIADWEGARLRGDPKLEIHGVRPFELARPGDITLAGHRGYLQKLEETRASAVIVPEGAHSDTKALLFSVQPKLSFARILARFHETSFQPSGVSPLASIGSGCKIPGRVSIHPFVRIGQDVEIGEEVTIHSCTVIGDGCRIGRGSILHPNVTLYPGVSLGERVILHSGCVAGADGFGYVFDGLAQVKLQQTGTVEIHDDVEIGANSCVDRATFGATVIEKNAKIDNHVHIGHNCKIGENTIIVGCVGISGSVEIGSNCILAGQSGVADHVKIGDRVQVMQKTAVTRDVPDGSKVSGLYGRDYRKELRIQAILQRLPEMYVDWKRIRRLLRLDS